MKEGNRAYSRILHAMAILLAMALPWLAAAAPDHIHSRESGATTSKALNSPLFGEAASDSLTVSLITCFPGPEIFELCGHAALRIRGEGRDSVWNYGVFSFNEPGFIYRFVKGETDYMGIGYPFAWFLPEYEARGSEVVEQDLNLTQPEARMLLARLQESSLPENRKYRYNYVKNNCSTKLTAFIESSLPSKVVFPDTVHYGTFRNEMRSYHSNYPWYQFGIDICLGSGIDFPLSAKEEMFVPVEAMKMISGAHLSDGRPLVRATRILSPGRTDAVLPPTPWWASPLTVSSLVFLASLAIALYALWKKKFPKWVVTIWFSILGLAGLLVSFLVFFSEHEATSPNILILWLNPLQFILAFCVWWRKTQWLAISIAVADCVAMICMILFWPFQAQSANPAFFPLMGTTLLLAASYALTAFRNREHAPLQPKPRPRHRKKTTVKPKK